MSGYAQLPIHVRALAVRELTCKQLDVFIDRANGHSWRTIAAAYGINEASARGLHRRALDRLEPHLRKEAA